jgi:hypothetical protein
MQDDEKIGVVFATVALLTLMIIMALHFFA